MFNKKEGKSYALIFFELVFKRTCVSTLFGLMYKIVL